MALPPLRGALLFAFIPLVLFLFLQRPLGVGPSLALGVALMLGHRFVARPYMRRAASRHCLWCSRRLGPLAMEFPLASQGQILDMRVCGVEHLARLEAFASFVATFVVPLRVLILGPLILFLLNGALAAVGLAHLSLPTANLAFQLPVALAVVGLAMAYPMGNQMETVPAIDFPLHNLFLLGVATTLWVFRIVGIWWIAAAVVRWVSI